MYIELRVNLLTLVWSLVGPSWAFTFPLPSVRLSLAPFDWTSCSAASSCRTILGLLLSCSAPIILLRGSAEGPSAGSRHESIRNRISFVFKFVLPNKDIDSSLSLFLLLWLGILKYTKYKYKKYTSLQTLTDSGALFRTSLGFQLKKNPQSIGGRGCFWPLAQRSAVSHLRKRRGRDKDLGRRKVKDEERWSRCPATPRCMSALP